MYEYHDAPIGGHRGREKTNRTVSRDFYCPRQYQFVRRYFRVCNLCKRVRSNPSLIPPLQPLSVPAEFWESVNGLSLRDPHRYAQEYLYSSVR